MLIKGESKRKIIAIVFGIAMSINMYAGVTYGEMISVILLPLYFMKKNRIVINKSTFIVIMSFILYIICQIVSDYYANENISVIIREFGKLMMILVLALSVKHFTRKDNNFIVYMLIAYLLAVIFQAILDYSTYTSTYNYWRNGIGESLTICALIISTYFAWPLKICIIISAIITNMILDYRTMIGLSTMVLFMFFRRALLNFSKVNRLVFVATALSLIILISGLFVYEKRNITISKRQQLSNTIRMQIIRTVISDLTNVSVIGNGHSSFNRNYVIPRFGNSTLEDKKNEIFIHGYALYAVYNAGKFAVLFYVIMFWHIAKILICIVRVGIFKPLNVTVYVMGVYFMYGSIMLAFSNFDRVVVAIAMAIVFQYSGSGRIAFDQYHQK